MRKTGVVNRTLPIGGSDDRVVLLHWSMSDEPRLRNVIRVDRHGNVLWRAELPDGAARDCFVSLEPDGAGFAARTYSGQVIRFDVEGRLGQEQRLALQD